MDRDLSPPDIPVGLPSLDIQETTTITSATGRPVPASTTRPETSRVSIGSEMAMSTSVASDCSICPLCFLPLAYREVSPYILLGNRGELHEQTGRSGPGNPGPPDLEDPGA